LKTLRNAFALAQAAKSFRPDVLHSFSRLAYLLPLLRSPLPKIMSYQRHTGGAQIRWATRLGGNSLRFTGCSEFICRMGRPSGGEWHAIPNFIEPDKIRFVPHVPAEAPLVFLSRVESIKGPDLAIAIARQAGRRLVIAGNRADSGPERDFWERSIAPHLGRDGVEYIGEVGDAEKNTLLGRAAALVVPVQWDEPFGIVFAEALAAGTPVISCARGALPEIVEPGRTGFLIRDVNDGVAAVNRLASLDRAACRHAAETRFSVGTCGARYLSLYKSDQRPVHPSARPAAESFPPRS
jgi:glycosyltransferase involved in cell wall biosynthesis